MSTSSQALLDDLITTVHHINHDIGPLARERDLPDQAYTTIAQMRDEELLVSQSLKAGITGVAIAEATQGTPVLPTESAVDSLAVVISEFGTARETTLSLVRELSGADWSRPLPEGDTIEARVRTLVERDAAALKRLYDLVGKPYPPASEEVHAG